MYNILNFCLQLMITTIATMYYNYTRALGYADPPQGYSKKIKLSILIFGRNMSIITHMCHNYTYVAYQDIDTENRHLYDYLSDIMTSYSLNFCIQCLILMLEYAL